ncbi:hypothetical protein EV138_1247 [Kribbella voronezhensis]|uniref:Uncharacterized protein n=1 Tax=Kribbella voronezhensis TaxID=2512212 RepID=A0A4R7T731_9ACTN|nr:hypothetical protein [Kribbella voronezhensis]TDU87720.1 hypothetical protein EV138_1247 [Kribbella voronezhensis]
MKSVLRRVLVPVVALIVGLLPGVIAVEQASAVTKMTQSQAASIFSAAGITWSSSGGCTTRSNSTCTSFEQINSTTVYGVRTLKQASGCAINITGGTEVGHASGTYSHYNGYKVDISKYTCIGNYIHNTFTRIANRGDGYPQWQSGAGNLYVDEGSHWDITYFNCGGC